MRFQFFLFFLIFFLTGDYKTLMARGRFPKPELVERGAMAWRGFSDVPGECWEPKDIVVGNTYLFQKRKMLVFDASEDTYSWMESEHGT